VIKGLTVYRRRWEAHGWAGVSNASMVRDVVARLRARSAPTTLRWVKGHAGVPGNEAADMLAKAAVDECIVLALPAPPLQYVASGVELICLTQKLAYGFIRRSLGLEGRKTTKKNLAAAKRALAELNCREVFDGMLWMGVWKLDADRPVRMFWWKMIHGAHRLGPYWLNIPGYHTRALCPYCGAVEDMEHLLCVCPSPWRLAIWSEAMALLVKRGIPVERLAFGHLMAVGLIRAPGGNGTPSPADSRLLRVVLTELVYFIWIVRCEWVIGKEGDPAKSPCVPEVLSRWSWRLNKRLRRDVMLARKAPKRMVVPMALILGTWQGLLISKHPLPDDWLSVSGVLVGR
ncbi:hypothetical protein C8T65DRAFT_519501, partial [Cerioporus squamosus]